MRQVADGSGYLVVIVVVQDDGDGADGVGNVHKPLSILFG